MRRVAADRDNIIESNRKAQADARALQDEAAGFADEEIEEVVEG